MQVFDITVAKIYSVKVEAKNKKEAEYIVMTGDESRWVYLNAEVYRVRKTLAMIRRQIEANKQPVRREI